MKLTPIDIKKQEFKRVLRGYDHAEVDAFLETLSNQWEMLLNEKSNLEQRARNLEMEIEKFKQVENMLHQTLAQAQQSSTSTVENAKKEAEIIKHEAQVEATRLVDNANMKVETINQNIQRLALQRHEMISKLRILLTSQLELLDSLHRDSDEAISQTINSKSDYLQKKSTKSEDIQKSIKEMSPEDFSVNTIDESDQADPDQYFQPVEPEKSESKNNLTSSQKGGANLSSQQNSLSSQTTRIEVPLDEPSKKGTSNRDLNIDDILDSLE